MRSLRRSLQLGISISLILSLALLWWLSNQQIRSLSEAMVESRLEHDTESLLASLSWREGGPSTTLGRDGGVYSRPFSGHYYQVERGGRVVLHSRSLWDHPLPAGAPLAPGKEETDSIPGPLDQHLLVYRAGFATQGVAFTLVVAEDLTPLATHLERFHITFALITLCTLLLLLGVQTQVVRRTTASLERLRSELRALHQGERSRLDCAVPQEVAPLVDEINHLVRQHAERLQRSRNATGNLAHALKGPLNLLGQGLDDPRLNELESVRRDLRHQLQRVRQLMERELKRARLAGREVTGSAFRPAQELPDLFTLLSRIHAERELTFVPYLDPVDPRLPMDREDMLELLGNLLDNAAKWAVSRVECHLREHAGQVRIMITDDGPGCPDEQLAQLTERGSRIDESIDGHGLGLAIVSDIVRLYGGELQFGRAAGLGGFAVRVTLPLSGRGE